METLMTVKDVAEKLRVSRSWISKRTRSTAVPRLGFCRVGGQLRFTEEHLQQYLALVDRAPSKAEWVSVVVKQRPGRKV